MTLLRRVSSWIHLYGGLALGGLLIVISVSGSALVFEDTMDTWLRPDLRHVEPEGKRVSMDRVLNAVRHARPDATPWIANLPTEPTDPVVVRLGPEAPSIFIDPYRARVLGVRGPDEGLMNTLTTLHVHLWAGTTGGIIVGVTGLLLVLLTATGLVLWWPRRLRALWNALRVAWRHGPLRINYDLHRAGGFYTTAFVLLTALTGSAFIFYPTTKQIMSTVTASAPWPPAPPTVQEQRVARDTAAIAYEDAMQAAQASLPSATPTYLYLPESETAPVGVRMRTPPEWHPNGRSFVYVRPADAAVLRVDDAREAPWGMQVLQTFYPLHIGAVGGLVGQWLYVLLGLAPAVLSVTGTIIWYQRWRRVAPSDEYENVGTRPVVDPSVDQADGEPVLPPRPS